jgi:hypothetical protein
LEPDRAKPPVDEIHSSGITLVEKNRRPLKFLCSYRGMDIRYSVAPHGVPELLVQCRFVKVRGGSSAIQKIHCNIASDGESDSEKSELNIEIGDYIKLDGKKVCVVDSISENGTVRCVSPTYPANEPIELTIEQVNQFVLH